MSLFYPASGDSKPMVSDALYTPLDQARQEIWERWNNSALRKQVLSYCTQISSSYVAQPRAVLSRALISANLEYVQFIEQSKLIGLAPLGYEYTGDKFCTMNRDKLCLAKMPIAKPGKHGGFSIAGYRKVIDMMRFDGKPFCDLATLWGEPFVSFHHRLLSVTAGPCDLLDASDWYSKIGGDPKSYYRYDLALFLCHGVLFENFITDGKEGAFFHEVVLPSYQDVMKQFGMKPLIVRLLPFDTQADLIWNSYPDFLEQEISLNHGYGCASSIN